MRPAAQLCDERSVGLLAHQSVGQQNAAAHRSAENVAVRLHDTQKFGTSSFVDGVILAKVVAMPS